MDDRHLKLLGITSGLVLFTIAFWMNQRKKPKPPNSWKRVGNLSQIMFYPVKSFGGIYPNSIECTQLGCKVGKINDRSFVVVDLNRKFLTARQIPKMVLVSPSVDQENDDVLMLDAPEMEKIKVDLQKIKEEKNQVKVNVWGDTLLGLDCGDDVAKWISQFLVQKDEAYRLVLYPLDKPTKNIHPSSRFPRMVKEDVGAYTDDASYMLMNQSSVDDLNSRLKDPITPLQFRPNFVVSGAEPFAEDNWDWIKIGDVIFRNIKPCTRCILTTIDPLTGCKHPETEPLKTLRSYRQLEGKYRRLAGQSPMMGINLGLKQSPGHISIGDPVFIAENSTPIEKIM